MTKMFKNVTLGLATLFVVLFGTGSLGNGEFFGVRSVFGYGGGGGGMSTGGTGVSAPQYSNSVSVSIGNTSGSIGGPSTLILNGGPSAVRMAISDSPDFSNISQEPYSTTKEWNVVPGQPIYVRFFDVNGNTFDTVISGTATNQTNTPTPTVNTGSGNGEVLGVKIGLVDDLISTTKFGIRNDDVKSLQTELRRLGYFPSNVRSTGYYGPITRAAVAKYLASQNTPNVLGVKITQVEGLLPKTKFGARSNDIKSLQTALRDAGYFPSNVRSTGYYGPITRAAVEKYLAAIQ